MNETDMHVFLSLFRIHTRLFPDLTQLFSNINRNECEVHHLSSDVFETVTHCLRAVFALNNDWLNVCGICILFMWYLHFSWHHEHRQWSVPISRLQHHSFVWVYIRLSKYQGPNTGNPINSSGACEFQVFSQQIVARFGKWNSIFSMRNFFSELKDHLYLSQKSIATKKPKMEFFGIFWKDWLFSCFFFSIDLFLFCFIFHSKRYQIR